MHNCSINNIAYLYPSNWDELNKQQLLLIVKGFYTGLNEIDLKVRTVLDFLKLQLANVNAVKRDQELLYYVKPKDGEPFYISPEQILFLARSLDFLTIEENDEEGQPIQALHSQLTRNLIPVFRNRTKSYYGPSDRLFTLTFAEYLEAEAHFRSYNLYQDSKYLDKLVATLYRPAKKKLNRKAVNYDGDPRRPFNSNLVELYAKKLKGISPVIKLSIFIFYQGCRRFLALNFPNVFETAPAGRKSNGYGSLTLIDALSGDDVTKNESVRKSLLYDVMVRLEKAATTNDKI